MPHHPQHLPEELTTLVNDITKAWGKVIQMEGGTPLFQKVENLRRLLKSRRQKSNLQIHLAFFQKLHAQMKKLPRQELHDITHSFSVLLQLINICENTVRSQKIRSKDISENIPPIASDQSICFVLTAHPTESRSAEVVATLGEIQKILYRHVLDRSQPLDEITPLLHRLWHLRLAKQRRPEVRDEAHYIYSIALRPEVLDLFLNESHPPVFLHTWVGGDKDGHPGVDEKVMLESLNMSRGHLLNYFENLLVKFQLELTQLQSFTQKKACERILQQTENVKTQLRSLRKLRKNDGDKIEQTSSQLFALFDSLPKAIRPSLAQPEKIKKLLTLFPGLVVPLEIRESSDVLRAPDLLSNKYAVYRMLKTIRSLCGQNSPRHYARGFIISMTENVEDLEIAAALVENIFSRKSLPIIPLFEQGKDLIAAPDIIEIWVRRHRIHKQEVMLGYSDSSKDIGALPSRLQIRRAMFALEKLTQKIPSLKIQYFHGSGGSIDRGGGRFIDQCAHWPSSALTKYKVTIQGEMIPRSFATDEILNQYLRKISSLRPLLKRNKALPQDPVLEKFSDGMAQHYRKTVSDPLFIHMVEKASAYRFLEKLYLGSRPSKRKKLEGVHSLRAIPWILGWTQTRILFPTWWGFGTAFSRMNTHEKKHFSDLVRGQDPLLASFMYQLEFTLAKMDLSTWFFYLQHSDLPAHEKKKFTALFQSELKSTLAAIKYIHGHSQLLQSTPWLAESILLRSPLIHPLNMAQLIAWGRKDLALLREATVGIAGGMLTTG